MNKLQIINDEDVENWKNRRENYIEGKLLPHSTFNVFDILC